MKVQAESFHLNGHIIGFRPQSQKLEPPYNSSIPTMAVKGLRALVLAKQYTRKDSLWTTLFVTGNTQETKLTDSFGRWFFVSNSLRTADVYWVKEEPKNASAPRRLCEHGHWGNKTTG